MTIRGVIFARSDDKGFVRSVHECPNCGTELKIEAIEFDSAVPKPPDERALENAQSILEGACLRSERDALLYGGSW